MSHPCMNGKDKASVDEIFKAVDEEKSNARDLSSGNEQKDTFVLINGAIPSSGTVESSHQDPIKEGKEISDDLSEIIEVLVRYFSLQHKKKDIDCFLCTDREKTLEHPTDIHILFKLYSALVYCMMEHCTKLAYENGMTSDLFNLENYLLDQIAVKELDFFDAYKEDVVDHRREQLIAMGNIFKIDDALHINREEEIESVTYKYCKKVGDMRLFSDEDVNLICLILYKRNESFRFFKIFKERRLLINYRLAVLFSLHNDCIYSSSEVINRDKGRKFEYDDISNYKLKNLFIKGGLKPTNYFEKMKYKLGLDKIQRESKEIEYEKVLEAFEGIIVTKKIDVNSREFRRWYNRERRGYQWMECVKMWIANRRMNKNVVDLSMIDMCTQFKEFEKGHYIYEMLEPIHEEKVLKDSFVKYCLLCIGALKEGNKDFNKHIVSNLDETFSKMICGDADETWRHKLAAIKNEASRYSHDPERSMSDRKTRNNSVIDSEIEMFSNRDDDNLNIMATVPSISEFRTNICSDLRESQMMGDKNNNASSFVENNGNKITVDDIKEVAANNNLSSHKNGSECSRSSSFSFASGSDFLKVWTERIVLLIENAKKIDKNKSICVTINRSMTEMIINNILYFEMKCRKNVLEALLCDICINDEMAQLILKGFYCYCLSCKESNLRVIHDCDVVCSFAEKIYKCWRKSRSSFNFFKRKDPQTRQTIYCCMLGVCCETEKTDQFVNVCKDLKCSSTELNHEMLKIFKRFHTYQKCNCDFFKNNPNRHYKKHIIDHIAKKK